METRREEYIYEFGGDLKTGHFARNVFIKKDENFTSNLEQALKPFSQEGSLYESAFGYETSEIDACSLIGDLYFDLDGDIETEEGYKKVVFQTKIIANFFKYYIGLTEDEIGIYFSGGKGFHLVIPYQCLDINPNPNINLAYKNIALQIAYECKADLLDLSIYDRRRLFRVPNTKNPKRGLYKVRLTFKQLYDFTLADLLIWAKTTQENKPLSREVNNRAAKAIRELLKKKIEIKSEKKRNFTIPTEEKELLPCAKNLLLNGAKQGTRNNAAVALASSLMQAGKKPADAYKILMSWNELNDPPLSEGEVALTFKSAHKMIMDGKIYGCMSYKLLEQCQKDCTINQKG